LTRDEKIKKISSAARLSIVSWGLCFGVWGVRGQHMQRWINL